MVLRALSRPSRAFRFSLSLAKGNHLEADAKQDAARLRQHNQCLPLDAKPHVGQIHFRHELGKTQRGVLIEFRAGGEAPVRPEPRLTKRHFRQEIPHLSA